MDYLKKDFGTFFWRITSLHMITYFVAGILAMTLFNYEENFEMGAFSILMKPFGSPWIAAGPGLQVIRGLIFSLVLWPFKPVLLSEKSGWLKLWFLFLGLAILGTSGPAPGSVEGLIYTKIPLPDQLLALPETVFQTLIFSILFCSWYRFPGKSWTIISIVLVLLVVLASIGGVLIPVA